MVQWDGELLPILNVRDNVAECRLTSHYDIETKKSIGKERTTVYEVLENWGLFE